MPPPDLPEKESCNYYFGMHFAFTWRSIYLTFDAKYCALVFREVRNRS